MAKNIFKNTFITTLRYYVLEPRKTLGHTQCVSRGSKYRATSGSHRISSSKQRSRSAHMANESGPNCPLTIKFRSSAPIPKKLPTLMLCSAPATRTACWDRATFSKRLALTFVENGANDDWGWARGRPDWHRGSGPCFPVWVTWRRLLRLRRTRRRFFASSGPPSLEVTPRCCPLVVSVISPGSAVLPPSAKAPRLGSAALPSSVGRSDNATSLSAPSWGNPLALLISYSRTLSMYSCSSAEPNGETSP